MHVDTGNSVVVAILGFVLAHLGNYIQKKIGTPKTLAGQIGLGVAQAAAGPAVVKVEHWIVGHAGQAAPLVNAAVDTAASSVEQAQGGIPLASLLGGATNQPAPPTPAAPVGDQLPPVKEPAFVVQTNVSTPAAESSTPASSAPTTDTMTQDGSVWQRVGPAPQG